MAILIRGESICALCSQIIEVDDEVRGFPAFLKSTHRLGKFSDATFHVRCLIGSVEAAEAQALYEKWMAIWDNRPAELKSMAEMETWGKAAFAEFTAEAERLNTQTLPASDSES